MPTSQTIALAAAACYGDDIGRERYVFSDSLAGQAETTRAPTFALAASWGGGAGRKRVGGGIFRKCLSVFFLTTRAELYTRSPAHLRVHGERRATRCISLGCRGSPGTSRDPWHRP